MWRLIWLLATVTAFGQFTDLAVTDDAAQIYFATSLRLKSEAGFNLPRTPAIYRFVDGHVERFTEPPPFNYAFPESHENPQLSGGGEIVVYTLVRSCVGGSSCFLNWPTTRHSRIAGDTETLLTGTAQVSRNGRYLLHHGRWATFLQRTEVRELRDLQAGERTEVSVWPAAAQQAVTSDGRVLGFGDEPDSRLRLWSASRIVDLRLLSRPSSAIINDTGNVVVYHTGDQIRAFDIAADRDVLVSSRQTTPGAFSITNDGSLIAYMEPGTGEDPLQVWVIRPDGTDRRQLTSVPEGVVDAFIAGFGRFVVAATANGRLLRITVVDGAVEELIGRSPAYDLAFGVLVPGSILPLRGSGMAASTQAAAPPLPTDMGGVRILADGQPLPLLSVSPGEIWFQTPFELDDGRPVRLELEDESLFDGGSGERLVVRRHPWFFQNAEYLLLAHEDFSALVTPEFPVRAGEIVHAWALGLGPVTPTIATGEATPLNSLYRTADTLDCGYDPQPLRPLEVLFAGLAPGMTGIYQVDIRMPDPLPELLWVSCGTPGSGDERHGGAVPLPRLN